jgi:hypothetical protein
MAKEIILYNLAANVTDEQYQEFVTNEKGPLFDSLASVEKFELVKIMGAATGEIPFKYIGIVHLKSAKDFQEKDAPSPKFQDFLKKWQPMTSGAHVLFGEEIY